MLNIQNIMSKHFFLLLASAFLFAGCEKDFKAKDLNAASDYVSDDARSSKPNIILILADDVGYEIPTYTGGQSYKTPNLDKLSKAGMQFTQCYSSPMCSPSRVMLLTGKYNFRNYTGWGALALDQRTFGNMLKTAGYNTYIAGKWQLDNGDIGVQTFGFDKSIIFEPFEDIKNNHDESPLTKGRYKSPELYVNGTYLNPSSVIGKYCDDILVDSITSYAAQSKAQRKPFFIYYPMSLAHDPFSPTPDDPEYASWDPTLDISDTSFFPSMIKYMDKKIGQVINRFDSMNLTKNTIFLFIGDNGTPHFIYSQYKGQTIQGGKKQTNVWGTHVPMLVYWKGKIAPGSVNNNLVDFTDFLSSLADIANTPKPTTYGQLDGVSFYPSLSSPTTHIRDWVFCHYDNDRHSDQPLYRFANNATYKLYDSSGYFYNMVTDPDEEHNIPVGSMTPRTTSNKKLFSIYYGFAALVGKRFL
jgi:arylsulfatase A